MFVKCILVFVNCILNAHFKGALLYISALYFSSSMTHIERDKLFDLHGSAAFRLTYEPIAQTLLCLIIH